MRYPRDWSAQEWEEAADRGWWSAYWAARKGRLDEPARAPLSWPVFLAFTAVRPLARAVMHAGGGRRDLAGFALGAWMWVLDETLAELENRAERRRARSLGLRRAGDEPEPEGRAWTMVWVFATAVPLVRVLRGRRLRLVENVIASLALRLVIELVRRWEWRGPRGAGVPQPPA